MDIAIVSDSSRKLAPKMYSEYNIFPLGYYLEDSKGKLHVERKTIWDLKTEELIKIAYSDKKAKLFAPTLKDYVELYTYLGEKYDHIISLHSSLFTPAVFENAILAKKLVSEIPIDVLDTKTFGCAANLLLEKLALSVAEKDNINEIKKEFFSLQNRIISIIVTKDDNFQIIGLKKASWIENIVRIKPWALYNFIHNEWKKSKTARGQKGLLKEAHKKLEAITKTKDLTAIYYYSSGILEKETETFLENYSEYYPRGCGFSLVSYYLLSNNVFDITIS